MIPVTTRRAGGGKPRRDQGRQAEAWFAADSPLEGDGFEPSVPLETLAPGPRTAWFAFCSPETR